MLKHIHVLTARVNFRQEISNFAPCAKKTNISNGYSHGNFRCFKTNIVTILELTKFMEIWIFICCKLSMENWYVGFAARPHWLICFYCLCSSSSLIEGKAQDCQFWKVIIINSKQMNFRTCTCDSYKNSCIHITLVLIELFLFSYLFYQSSSLRMQIFLFSVSFFPRHHLLMFEAIWFSTFVVLCCPWG